MIKFEIEKEKVGKLYFWEVKEYQFFIDEYFNLGQKVDHTHYQIIADKNGRPWAGEGYEIEPEDEVLKIFPQVTKITWE